MLEHATVYWLIPSVFLVGSVEIALLATPRLRTMRAGALAENVLRRTRFYPAAKSLYWSVARAVTPRLLRLWVGRSRACSFNDLLNYSRIDKQNAREKEAVKAAAEFLRRDSSGYELWRTFDCDWWTPEGESNGLFDVLAEQKRDIYGDGEISVRLGDIVLDCGANVGCFARCALSLGAKLVVTLEPARDNLECLRRNLATEIASGRVIVCPKGVWDREEWLFLSGSGVGWRVSKDGPEGSQGQMRVPLTTIDSLVRDLLLERVDFIKMDIEGCEAAAVVGARNTLSAFKPRLAVAGYHKREDSEVIPRVVLEAWPGYRMRFGRFYSPGGGARPETLLFL